MWLERIARDDNRVLARVDVTLVDLTLDLVREQDVSSLAVEGGAAERWRVVEERDEGQHHFGISPNPARPLVQPGIVLLLKTPKSHPSHLL